MKYQLKQDIDREEMRAERVEVPVENLNDFLLLLRQQGENAASISEDGVEEGTKAVKVCHFFSKWAAYYIDPMGIDPSISVESFISKYFEPCDTK